MAPILGSDIRPYVTNNGFAASMRETVSLIDERRKIYDSSNHCYEGLAERRRSTRANAFLPAIVRGVEASGKKFKTEAVVENFSSTGLYLRFKPTLSVNDSLLVVFKFSNSGSKVSAPQVAIQGIVHRLEDPDPADGGEHIGVAVKIRRFRFL